MANNTAVAGRYGYVTMQSESSVAHDTGGFDGETFLPLTEWTFKPQTETEGVTNFTSETSAIYANDPSVGYGSNTWEEDVTTLSKGMVTLKGKIKSDWKYYGLGMPNGSRVTAFLGFRNSTGPGGQGGERYVEVDLLIQDNDFSVAVAGVGEFSATGKIQGAPKPFGF